jgi:hypothetical protein
VTGFEAGQIACNDVSDGKPRTPSRSGVLFKPFLVIATLGVIGLERKVALDGFAGSQGVAERSVVGKEQLIDLSVLRVQAPSLLKELYRVAPVALNRSPLGITDE